MITDLMIAGQTGRSVKDAAVLVRVDKHLVQRALIG